MKNILFVVFAFLAFGSVSVKAQGECDICQTVVQLIEGWVENNATVSQIEQYLDGICNLIPSYGAICQAIVNQGIPEIIQFIEQNETPQQICTQLGLCSSVTVINGGLINTHKLPLPSLKELQKLTPGILTAVKPAKNGAAQCDLCQQIIGAIENWMANTNDQAEVITAIEVVCTYMPQWQTTCDAIIEAGVPTVVQWIVQNDNSTQVCQQLGICPSEKKVVAPKQDECGICEQIVTAVYYYVNQNYTESVIANYLDIACTVVPQWTQVCETFVSEELPQIISWVEQNESPDTICTNLGVCSSKKPVPLVHIN
jgi:saposin